MEDDYRTVTHYDTESGRSNIGDSGYKNFVSKLKERIIDGDIIQCVPSHVILSLFEH